MAQISKSRITDVQFLEVIRKVTLPTISFSMAFAHLDDTNITSLQNLLSSNIFRRLKLADSHYLDWLTMDISCGGLNIPSISTLNDCQITSMLSNITNGPDCSAKTLLFAQLAQESNSSKIIKTNDADSLWMRTKKSLKKHGFRLQTRLSFPPQSKIFSSLHENPALSRISTLLTANEISEKDQITALTDTTAKGYTARQTVHINTSLSILAHEQFEISREEIQAINQITNPTDRATSNRAQGKFTPQRIPTELRLANKRFTKSGRIINSDNSNINARVLFTDGSKKNDAATWSISSTTTEKYVAQQTCDHVEGTQSSYRAELTAIFAVVSSLTDPQYITLPDYREMPADDVIATDSLSAIKAITNFHKKKQSEKQRTLSTDQDLLRAINNHMHRCKTDLKMHIWLLYVPAHTIDDPTNTKED